MRELSEDWVPKCYIIFDYLWHLSGIKPAGSCFKSFDSVKEAGEYLISIFSRDMDEGIFESLLSEEEMAGVEAVVAELEQNYVDDKEANYKVTLDLSCFEFKIIALCIWPDGAKKILETVVQILKEQQGEDFEERYNSAEESCDSDDDDCHSFYKKAQVLLNTNTSAPDREKFDKVFNYMICSHSYDP